MIMELFSYFPETTVPRPIIELLLICVPFKIVAFAPSQTSSPIFIGFFQMIELHLHVFDGHLNL